MSTPEQMLGRFVLTLIDLHTREGVSIGIVPEVPTACLVDIAGEITVVCADPDDPNVLMLANCVQAVSIKVLPDAADQLLDELLADESICDSDLAELLG